MTRYFCNCGEIEVKGKNCDIYCPVCKFKLYDKRTLSIIMQKEMKLNRMEQEEIRPSKKNSKRKNKQFPYKRNRKIPSENRNKTKHLNSPKD